MIETQSYFTVNNYYFQHRITKTVQILLVPKGEIFNENRHQIILNRLIDIWVFWIFGMTTFSLASFIERFDVEGIRYRDLIIHRSGFICKCM